MNPGRDDEPADAREADLWDVPTEPQIAAPRWPPDADPFVTLGLLDDLI